VHGDDDVEHGARPAHDDRDAGAERGVRHATTVGPAAGGESGPHCAAPVRLRGAVGTPARGRARATG
jgi:hypothetical protein